MAFGQGFWLRPFPCCIPKNLLTLYHRRQHDFLKPIAYLFLQHGDLYDCASHAIEAVLVGVLLEDKTTCNMKTFGGRWLARTVSSPVDKRTNQCKAERVWWKVERRQVIGQQVSNDVKVAKLVAKLSQNLRMWC